jgi:polygalacturonase
MSGCWAAVRIKTRRGRGGYVEDVHVSDCVANDNKAALLIDTQYKWTPGLDAIPGPEGIPVLKNFSFANVTGVGNKAAINMVGMPERPIEGVVIESVQLDGPLAVANVTGTGLPSGK